MKILLFFIFLISSHSFYAEENTKIYTGIAKNNQKIVYTEYHTLEYDSQNKLLKSETVYFSNDGKKIADLNSDFTKNLFIPTCTTRDFRTGESQGILTEKNSVILFYHEKNKEKITKKFMMNNTDGRILIGCQGFHYYILTHLLKLNSKTSNLIPLRLFIPGKLDYYDFDLKLQNTNEKNIANFEIKVKNWFLKIFVPTLTLTYDSHKKRLLQYDGVSNLKDLENNNQKVKIEYNYPKE